MPAPAARTVAVALAAGAVATMVAGCGTSQAERDQARRQAEERQRLKEKAAGLEEEIRQLKEQQPPGATAVVQGQAAQPATAPPAGSRACGGGVAAGRKTSCAFALNTAREWVDTSGGTQIQVYSPATARSYTVRCSASAGLTTCRGGKGAVVYIP